MIRATFRKGEKNGLIKVLQVTFTNGNNNPPLGGKTIRSHKKEGEGITFHRGKKVNIFHSGGEKVSARPCIVQRVKYHRLQRQGYRTRNLIEKRRGKGCEGGRRGRRTSLFLKDHFLRCMIMQGGVHFERKGRGEKVIRSLGRREFVKEKRGKIVKVSNMPGIIREGKRDVNVSRRINRERGGSEFIIKERHLGMCGS